MGRDPHSVGGKNKTPRLAFNAGFGFAITAGSKNKDIGWELIKFATSQAYHEELLTVTGSGIDPDRYSGLTSPKYKAFQPLVQPLLDAVPWKTALPGRPPPMRQARKRADGRTGLALAGTKSAEQAIRDAPQGLVRNHRCPIPEHRRHGPPRTSGEGLVMGNEEWSPVTPLPTVPLPPCPRRPGGPCQERAAISLARTRRPRPRPDHALSVPVSGGAVAVEKLARQAVPRLCRPEECQGRFLDDQFLLSLGKTIAYAFLSSAHSSWCRRPGARACS